MYLCTKWRFCNKTTLCIHMYCWILLIYKCFTNVYFATTNSIILYKESILLILNNVKAPRWSLFKSSNLFFHPWSMFKLYLHFLIIYSCFTSHKFSLCIFILQWLSPFCSGYLQTISWNCILYNNNGPNKSPCNGHPSSKQTLEYWEIISFTASWAK